MVKTKQGKTREKTMVERYGKDWKKQMGKRISDGHKKKQAKNKVYDTERRRQCALKGWETRRAKEQVILQFEEYPKVKVPFAKRFSAAIKLIFVGHL